MCEAAQVELRKNSSVHSIHGSLLAVGELLRNTGEFMMSRYREVADIVLKYLEHRDRLVRLSITSLLPRIAHFLRGRFVSNYLKFLVQDLCTEYSRSCLLIINQSLHQWLKKSHHPHRQQETQNQPPKRSATQDLIKALVKPQSQIINVQLDESNFLL